MGLSTHQAIDSSSITPRMPGCFTVPGARRCVQAADYSHRDNHSHPELAQLAKANIELDRLLAAAEGGYSTALLRLLQPAMTTKADVLVGVPRERVGSGELCWVWR
jgi:hypothetical protein